MTGREQDAAGPGLLLCMMALSGGLNGGNAMGQNMSFHDMQNAVQASQSTLWAVQMGTQQVNRMANCQTINPLCRAMEPVKKCWDCAHCSRLTGWCNLFDDYAVRQKTEWQYAGCKWWKSKSGDPDGPEKKHETCKHFERETKWCTLFEQYAENAEPYCGKHAYWEPNGPEAQEPSRVFIDYGADIDNVTQNVPMTLFQLWDSGQLRKTCVESDRKRNTHTASREQCIEEINSAVHDAVLSAVQNLSGVEKPERKRLTLDDLYNLAFPVDPIRDHFEGVCKQIEADHEKRMEILDRVEVVPVERVQVLREQDGQSEQNGRALGGVVELCAAFVVWLVVASFNDTLNAVGFVSFLVSFALVRFVIKKFFSQRGD